MTTGKFGLIGKQQELELFPVKEVEIEGVKMGVLSDGTPYLTLTGLAKMCGISPPVLLKLAANWSEEKLKPRGEKIQSSLFEQGYDKDVLYTRVMSNGVETHAYPDAVCMAILEYYALESQQAENRIAKDNYKVLARSSFKLFIYNRVGYNPSQIINNSWGVYQQRIVANDNIPLGYFSIFREMADLTVRLINSEFNLDPHSIPDISVGIHWANFWKKNNFDVTYGKRTLHEHNYPKDFPQSKGTQKEAYIYPTSALGTFRDWISTTYVNQHLAPYLEKKVKEKALPAPQVEKILLAVQRPELPKPR